MGRVREILVTRWGESQMLPEGLFGSIHGILKLNSKLAYRLAVSESEGRTNLLYSIICWIWIGFYLYWISLFVFIKFSTFDLPDSFSES